MRPVSVLLAAAAATNALACACVGAHGAAVRMAGQKDLVVWDKDTGVEHFVRDARFTTSAKDLGFLAPTPGRPNLGTADPKVFDDLDALAPATKSGATSGTKVATQRAAPDAVRVVEARDVAGYRATVLKATDAAALRAWLGENGYPSPEYLTRWLAPYVKRGWYLTAFRVEGEVTGPVRMSFQTGTPFNPYSVPAANGGQAPLRLYFVSAGREVPLVGGERTWREPTWSVTLTPGETSALAESLFLTPDRIPENARLTVYDDPQFGRPGLDDLYFVADERPLEAGVGVGVGLLAVGGFVALRRRREKGVSRADARVDPETAADDR